MAKKRRVNMGRSTRSHKSEAEEQANRQAGGVCTEIPSLTSLQQRLGNRALQRVLTGSDGQGSIALDRETVAHLSHEHSFIANVLTDPTIGTMASAQSRAAVGAIQREVGQEEAPATAGTVVIQNPSFDYYDVTGSTLSEVAAQLDPEEWGRCQYHYDYTYETTDGQTSTVNIVLRLQIRLPRWQGEGWDHASGAVKAEWRRMLQALRAHENRHAEISRPWAPTFKERLLNLPEADIQGEHAQVLQEVNDEQDQFDDETDHGQNQGVSLDTSIE